MELYIYTIRESIELYRKRSTTVFVTFLDASKALDRHDHWLLFKKLIKRKVPLSAWPEARETADTDGGAYSPFRSILFVLTYDFIITQLYGPACGDG